jgi:hypothetical protein
MIPIAETLVFKIGKYTVRRQARPDNPAWPCYWVFIDGDVVIGKSFSVPDLSCCEWLERQERDRTIYAYTSAPARDVSGARRGRAFSIHRDKRKAA